MLPIFSGEKEEINSQCVVIFNKKKLFEFLFYLFFLEGVYNFLVFLNNFFVFMHLLYRAEVITC